jgi:thiamine-monophosphate kinase
MASQNGSADNSERSILRAIRALAQAGSGVRVGIGDDCAVLSPRSGEEMLVTTDFSIEGRHFHLNTHPPEAIGHKCLARGLSDIASMGGRPVAAFVSLAIPAALTRPSRKKSLYPLSNAGSKTSHPSWLERFYNGLLALAAVHGVTLAGGDLSESPTAVADIIVVGAAPKGRALLRSTARPGDFLYVTGRLGGAASELATLAARPRKTPANGPEHPHFYPQPRVAAGHVLLRRKFATACIDISDGLSVDLLHLCDESKVNAELEAAALPIYPGATLEEALHGGDDYELLFTASPGTRIPRILGGVAIHRIGHMTAPSRGSRASRLFLLSDSGQRKLLQSAGWQHFQPS